MNDVVDSVVDVDGNCGRVVQETEKKNLVLDILE